MHIVVFSYRKAYKVTTNYIPFALVYGLHPLMPTEYVVPTRRSDRKIEYTPIHVLTAILTDLEQMDSFCTDAQQMVSSRQ